jgi:hypothetical protein
MVLLMAGWEILNSSAARVIVPWIIKVLKHSSCRIRMGYPIDLAYTEATLYYWFEELCCVFLEFRYPVRRPSA